MLAFGDEIDDVPVAAQPVRFARLPGIAGAFRLMLPMRLRT